MNPESYDSQRPTTDPVEDVFNQVQPRPSQAGGETRTASIGDVGLDDLQHGEHDAEHVRKRTISQEAHAFLNAVFSWIIIPLFIVVIIHNFIFQPYHVVGSSMAPNLHERDYLIISKVSHTIASIQKLFGQNVTYIPERGQVIVFRFPKKTSEIFVKRVIGVPGDRVVIKNGQITVYNPDNPNGFNPDASYEPSGTTTLDDVDVTVSSDAVFVVGDNREPGASFDSRGWGELKSEYIIGNAVIRLLPLDHIKAL